MVEHDGALHDMVQVLQALFILKVITLLHISMVDGVSLTGGEVKFNKTLRCVAQHMELQMRHELACTTCSKHLVPTDMAGMCSLR